MWKQGAPWKERLFVAAAVACASIGLYLNTLGADLVYDDTRAILSNADLRPSSPWAALIRNDFWGTPLTHSGSHKSFRPVCTATFRLNYLAAGLDPYGYHLANVLLHAAACLLAYILAVRLFNGDSLPAAGSAALFAVHPVHSEAVAGVVGRADVLACVFFLLAFLCHLRAAGCSVTPSPFDHHHPPVAVLHPHPHPPGGGGGGVGLLSTLVWMGCVGGCAALSMLSKESGVTVLGVAGVYDLLVLTRPPLSVGGIGSLLLHAKYKLFRVRMLCITIFGGLLIFLRLQAMGLSAPSFSPADNPAASQDSLLTRSLTFLHLPAVNFGLLLFPNTLSFDWSMDAVPLVESLTDLRNLATVLFYGSLLMVAVLALKEIQRSSSNVVPLSQVSKNSDSLACLQQNMNMNNANAFLPQGVDIKMRRLPSKIDYYPANKQTLQPVQMRTFSRKSSTAAQALVFGLSTLVIPFLPASNLFFHVGFVVAERVLYIPSLGFCVLVAHGVAVLYGKCSSDSLRKAVLVVCAVCLALLSWRTYLRNWDWHSEESLYRSGIVTNPAKGWGNLGNSLSTKGHNKEAEIAYQNALRHRPNMADAHYNYGTLLLNMERYQEAAQRFQDAITYRPKLAAAYLNLGIALTNMNLRKDAVKVYNNCIVLSDEGLKNPKAHRSSITSCLFNLGKIFIEDNQPEEAIGALQQAVNAAPGDYSLQGVYNLLGEAYTVTGSNKEAQHYLEQSLQTKPGHLPAVINFAKLLQAQGRHYKALEVLAQGKQYHPTRHELFLQEGLVLLETGDVSRAKESFTAAVELEPLGSVDVVLTAAHAFRERKHMTEAEHFYRLAVKHHPNSAQAHSNLGACLHLMRNYPAAEQHYSRSLQLNPSDAITRDNLKKMKAAAAKNMAHQT